MKTTSISIKTSDGTSLHGQLLFPNIPSQSLKSLLVIHGWKSSLKRFPKRVAPLVEAGYVCLVFDMRGHGATGGNLSSFSAQDHLDDCLAAYDFLASQQHIDPDHISVLGSSYGGYLATLLTKKRPVERLILLSPAQYPNEMFATVDRIIPNKNLSEYRSKPHTIQENRSLQAVADFKGKTLLIQPENDTQVHAQVFADFVTAAGNRLTHVIIPEADHSYYHGETNQEMISVLNSWMTNERTDETS